MATQSDIIVQMRDGKFHSIYCHWDGYLSHHRPILLEHYNSQELAEALVRLGDLSILAEHCTEPEGHSFDEPIDGYCVYYSRDRGEDDRFAIIKDTEEEVLFLASDITYLWSRDHGEPNGAWYFYNGTTTVLLSEAVET